MGKIYGAIEGGGTKFVCAVGRGPDQLLAETRFPTTSPEETMKKTISFFKEQQELHGNFAALGFASFGPLDLDLKSPTYGHIALTPKPGWSYTNVCGQLREAFGVVVGFDTDVNGAVLSEWLWGAGRKLDNLVYLTIGTGIGGGILIGGHLVHGLVHPEMGHMFIPHDRERDPFPGNCPFHGDCLEGLANGPAIEKRWGVRGETLPVDHPAWELEAEYLAYALVNLTCTLSPQRIIIGGGVMAQKQLFPLIRQKFQRFLNGYVHHPQIIDSLDQYIVPPDLGARAGLLGALALAIKASNRDQPLG